MRAMSINIENNTKKTYQIGNANGKCNSNASKI